MPAGSRSRLQRIQQGRHPEAGERRLFWPDGRPGHCRLATHQLWTPKLETTDEGPECEDSETDNEAFQLEVESVWPDEAPPREALQALQSFVLKEGEDAFAEDRPFNLRTAFDIFSKQPEQHLRSFSALCGGVVHLTVREPLAVGLGLVFCACF